MVKLHIPRTLPVNSFKLELGGGPGRAGGGLTEVGLETEVQLVVSALVQNAEIKQSRSEADYIDMVKRKQTLLGLHIGLPFWMCRVFRWCNILLTYDS